MTNDKPNGLHPPHEAVGLASDDVPTTTAASSETPDEARTLFLRVGAETKPLNEKTRARRARLISHAERSAARRQALAELLRSGALAEAVTVDPLLRRDVMRLVDFVRGGDAPPA